MTELIRKDFKTSQALAEAALEILIERADKAIKSRGKFVLALAGGTTPACLYEKLAETEQDWSRWQLVYGDERCLPEEHPERNSTLVKNSWLDKVSFPHENHHVPDFEAGVDEAAQAYASLIEFILPLDLVLLGMGEDGHTASLFPGHECGEGHVIAVHASPKPPAERVSLSYRTINSATMVCLLVTGEQKLSLLEADSKAKNLPVNRVSGREQTVLLTSLAK